MDVRKTLISSGEHLAAVCKLGDSYSAEEYVAAVELARAGRAGETYADRVLGVDIDAVVNGVVEDDGEATVQAAERRLQARGIDPKSATYEQYAKALAEVAS